MPSKTPDTEGPVLGRILSVASCFPRWDGDSSGCFVLNLAQDLQACGWQVDVLAPHCFGAARRETLGGVAVERFRYWWPEAGQSLCYGGGALSNLRRNPLRAVKVPPLVASEALAVLRRLAWGRYDAVHSHWLLPQGFVCEALSRVTQVPHVATVHGGEVMGLRGPLMTAAQRFVLRGADAVTVNSPAMASELRRIAPGLEGAFELPMGITTGIPPDPAAVDQLRRQHRRGGGPLLVFVGRLVEEKGLGDLIRAVALLAPACPDLTALVIGDGDARPDFEALVRDAGVADRVRFLGRVEPEQVRDYMAAGDIFVGPSWQEPFGLVFAEALEVATPVVATRVGGIVESVRHEDTGLLIDPRAPDQIAAGIRRFIEDPALAKRTAAAGQSLVRSRFSRARIAEAFSDVFRQCLVRPADALQPSRQVTR